MEPDQLARHAATLIKGWRRRYVSYETWGEAYDTLCDMGMIDLPRAESALDRFMGEYAQWVAIWGESPTIQKEPYEQQHLFQVHPTYQFQA